ncbi:aldose reductase-like [Cryptomeria japonica]|uniref:aldose reductase-like n=1 Tax=Cryptomeria japonica TaxID=3369 RepID=UPI0025AD0812|nr:aldose reductase-like [Cryptomeria japonica]
MLAKYSEEIMEVFQKNAQLNTEAKIPLIGLGTVAVDQNEEVIEAAVTTALEVGYRHFDTASLYNSERPLGKALHAAFQNGLVNREDVIVTTKLWDTQHNDPVTAIKSSLKYDFLVTISALNIISILQNFYGLRLVIILVYGLRMRRVTFCQV